ncbi:MAG: hypothetical protein C0408_06285, partial [Odoribacter sp.]|nr:hypothetical protein [Odoribacter sp.]
MKRTNLMMTILLVVFMVACSNQPSFKPPVAEKIPHELFDKRNDNYFWLRLSDEQKNAATPDVQTGKVLDYLKKENEYTKTVLKNTESLQKALYD